LIETFKHAFIGLSVLIVFIWSAIQPHDYFTWFLEVVPAIIGAVVLLATYRSFKFTIFVYFLIGVHAIILMIGGHYTYAEVPLFNWIKEVFHLSRNHYDRLGHFAQGFIPAMIAREIFLRKSPLKRGKWLYFITAGICLAISASYELFEFAVAELTGAAADAFLGSQGDPWDTQWDMTYALIGSNVSLIFFSKIHDRFLVRLGLE